MTGSATAHSRVNSAYMVTYFVGGAAGSLLGAVFLARVIPLLIPAIREHMDLVRTVLWLIALMLVGPVIIAAFRKMKALGMILADLGITESTVRANTQ